jgi:putative sterol carrier protein
MESKTPKEFFEKDLPMRFHPEKAVDVDVKAQVNITGLEGGEWTVTIKDQKLHVVEGKDSAAPLVLKMNDNDFMDIVNKRVSAEKAFFTGKIQFKGNLAMVLKLRDAGFL